MIRIINPVSAEDVANGDELESRHYDLCPVCYYYAVYKDECMHCVQFRAVRCPKCDRYMGSIVQCGSCDYVNKKNLILFPWRRV